jgi:hypothetical protein
MIGADGATWSFVPGDTPPRAARTQAILRVTVVDEITGLPPVVPLAVSTTPSSATARNAGSLIGVVGQPRTLFPDIGIALARASMTITAAGFLPLGLSAAMGLQADYPDSFTPPDLGEVALHRAPVVIGGRVVSRSLGPLAGAVVEVTRVWRQLDAIAGPGDPPDCLSVFAGLRADRAAGAAVAGLTLPPAPDGKRLRYAVRAGDSQIAVTDRVAIAPGQLLTIDPGDPDRIEYIGIAAIGTASSPDQPAIVTLDLPLRHDHPAGVVAVRAVAGAAGPGNGLARAARRGDVSLFGPPRCR